MKLISDGEFYDPDIHDHLMECDPWGDCADSKFVGKLVIGEDYSTDKNDVVTYQFQVSEMLEDFIDNNIVTGDFDGVGFLHKDCTGDAKMMVADLREMVARLESVILPSESK